MTNSAKNVARNKQAAEWRANNRDKVQAANRKWHAANKDKARTACQAWHTANKDKANAASRAWRVNNREARRKYIKNRLATDPEFKLLHTLRTRLVSAIKCGSKVASIKKLLDMEISEFKIYLQGQFLPGMAWENHGPIWHIDHIRPCASFDFNDPEQQRACFHWSNLQPLFAKDNREKGAKYVPVG